MNAQLSLFEPEYRAAPLKPASNIIRLPVVYDPDPLNYDKLGNYVGPPPDGYVWASTFKKDGTRKRVARNSHKGEEKKTYPIINTDQLMEMAAWIYKNKDKKYLLAFTLGVNLGLRANELLSLRRHDLFFSNGDVRYIDDIADTSDRIRIYQKKTRNSKGSKYRYVFLNSACVNILNWYFPSTLSRLYTDCDVRADLESIQTNHCRGGGDIVFGSPKKKGESLSVDMLGKVLDEAAKACGLPQNVCTHTLRKTFALSASTTRTVGGMDIDIAKAQRLLGHSSGTVTLRYLNTDQMNDKADYHSTVLDVAGYLI